jgi:hypothetical protein
MINNQYQKDISNGYFQQQNPYQKPSKNLLVNPSKYLSISGVQGGISGPTGNTGHPGLTGVPGNSISTNNINLILKEAMLLFGITEEEVNTSPSVVISKLRNYKISKIVE